MKKIALITASLALLASPAFAEDAKTTGNAPAEAKFSTVSKDEMFSSKLKGPTCRMSPSCNSCVPRMTSPLTRVPVRLLQSRTW